MTEKPVGDHLYGELKDPKYIHFLEEIEKVVKESGHETHLPHRDINKWGRIYLQPAETVSGCYDAIAACDIFIAYPGKSRGVHVEMGWASSLGKRIILLLDAHEKPSLIVSGLHAVSKTEILEFQNIEDLKVKLKLALAQ